MCVEKLKTAITNTVKLKTGVKNTYLQAKCTSLATPQSSSTHQAAVSGLFESTAFQPLGSVQRSRLTASSSHRPTPDVLAKEVQHAHLVVGNTVTWTGRLYMGMGIPDEIKEYTGVIKAIDRTNYIVTIICDGRDILLDATQLPKN
jgi:hypothetical protein